MFLSGELLNIATVPCLRKVLEDATDLFGSIERPLIISRILEGFETLKAKQSQGQLPLRADAKDETWEIPPPNLAPSDYTQDPIQPSPIAPPVLQFLALNPSYPGFLVDLNYALCIEWQNYSCRGDPL